jgi:hypothetical protein
MIAGALACCDEIDISGEIGRAIELVLIRPVDLLDMQRIVASVPDDR